MKTLHKLLWACCLTASLTACKDDTDTLLPSDELPPLPTDIITGDRAMWVSYDPTPDADANATTGIHGALVSWRMLPTDPANTAFDLYKSVNDDNGNELWCTGNGHGDCLSVGKFVKDREGLQIVASFEEPGNYAGQGHGYACQVIDARDGSLIAGHGAGDHGDVGRSIVADIDPDSPNFEYWSSINSGLYNCGGPSDAPVTADLPKGIGGGTMYNAAIYWSGELTRDLWDRGLIMSYRANPLTKRNRLVNFSTGYGSNQGNHSTKYNPCYYGDFLGDWREEVILGSEDNKSILVFSTNYPTHHRFTHLMEDHTYDLSQAMQNMGYNQQTNLGFYLGADMNR